MAMTDLKSKNALYEGENRLNIGGNKNDEEIGLSGNGNSYNYNP
jgi:hypothetical protein